jgi:hypothetical protein
MSELAEWRNQAVVQFGLTPHSIQNKAPLVVSDEMRVRVWWPLLAAAIGVAILCAGLLNRYGPPR